MENEDKLHDIRHSLAHLLAIAVLKHDPQALLGVGPVIENGFYYDFLLSSPLKESDLSSIEKNMKKLIGSRLDFTGKEIPKKEGQELFKDQPFKLELLEEFATEDKTLTAYTTGTFTDLCRGGHVHNTSEINADGFKLERIAGAYWKGDQANQQLTRIYGLAFETKEQLDNFLHAQEEAVKRDHKKLGRELDLFVFSDLVGKGLPLWTPRGATIRRELERFIFDEEIRRGYLHVMTPDIAKVELYEKSGHYPHYKDSMYAPIQIDEERFMLRPMTCPHHFELYLSRPHSYRELPYRIAELAKLYRYEQSGELSGLQRVRSFCLADAHIICADEEQAISEIGRALDLIEYATKVFGLTQGTDYWYRLSLGDRTDDKKYFKNDAAWNKGEDLMRRFLTKRGCKFVEAKNEAAFYGPKIDIQMKNVNGKEDTAFTVQYDFALPERFNLTYNASDGTEKRALVVHRSSIGAIERIMAFLIEHYGGAFPAWLSPTQVVVIPVSEKVNDYASEIFNKLKEENFRVELDSSSETLGKRIRNAKLIKIPYMIIIGEQEVASGKLTVESRNKGQLKDVVLEDFVRNLKEEIRDKKL